MTRQLTLALLVLTAFSIPVDLAAQTPVSVVRPTTAESVETLRLTGKASTRPAVCVDSRADCRAARLPV
ncbi:MAG: hypothetical protein AAGJ52_08685, partial [Pseudomonadota bacterium]